MPKRKKKFVEGQPVEAVQPTEVIKYVSCSQGYDYEVPTVRSLIVDTTTLEMMLRGTYRPFEKYDQVMYQAATSNHFSLFLAFKAVRCGGLLWVRPELAGMRMFQDCSKAEIGGMVRITKK